MTQIEQCVDTISLLSAKVPEVEPLELRVIYECSQAVGCVLDLDNALSQILHILHTTLSMEYATLVLLDETSSISSIRASYGLPLLKLHQTICCKEKNLVEENRSLRAEICRPHSTHNIIGTSKAIYEVLGKRPHSLSDPEREEVEAALRRHGWVQVRAARDLGLTQRQIG